MACDRRTDGQTLDDSIYRTNIASCGRKKGRYQETKTCDKSCLLIDHPCCYNATWIFNWNMSRGFEVTEGWNLVIPTTLAIGFYIWYSNWSCLFVRVSVCKCWTKWPLTYIFGRKNYAKVVGATSSEGFLVLVVVVVVVVMCAFVQY